LSFCSISSAIASFSASRTVISFVPLDDTYPLLLAIDSTGAVARNAGRKAGAGLEADTSRTEGRKSLAAAIAVTEVTIEVEEGKGRGRWRRGDGWVGVGVLLMADEISEIAPNPEADLQLSLGVFG
jgi:hypothetical protein